MSQLEQFSTISLENFDQKRKHYEVANKRRVEADNIIDYLVANLESLITSQVISNLKVRSRKPTCTASAIQHTYPVTGKLS